MRSSWEEGVQESVVSCYRAAARKSEERTAQKLREAVERGKKRKKRREEENGRRKVK